MKQWRKYNFVALLLLLSLLLPLATVYAGEGEEAIGQGKLRPGELRSPTEAISKMLSGRVWLITSGLDPVLSYNGGVKDVPASSGGGSPAAQAGGGGAALVPYRDPSAKFSRNVLIPRDFSSSTYQTEPSIAVDPKDPDHILVGMIDYNFPNMVTYSSIDGGATWEGPSGARFPRQDLASAGDPIVAFDSKGKAYYAYISLDVEEFTVGPILGQFLVSAISVSSSPDGGTTWERPTQSTPTIGRVVTRLLPSSDGRVRGEIEASFLDKPWMTVGRSPTSPDKDVLYVVYTNFIETAIILWADEIPFLEQTSLETVIEAVRSEDGGVTWSKPIEVSPRARYTILLNPITDAITQEEVGIASGDRQVVQGPDAAVAPDGTVYVAWMDTTKDDTFEGQAEIYVARSDDGGATFKRPQRTASFLEPGFRSRDTRFRSWASGFPKLGIGPKGEVYVAYVGIPTNNPEDDGDLFLVSSTNKGQTWSRRVRINDDETSSFQFFPEIAVDPKGTIHAMWGDFRDDPFHVRFHIYYASSEDGGQTWSRNSRVTDFASNPNRAFTGGRFIGDYFGMAATGEDVYMVWADARLGEFGSPNQKIAFARQRLMPSPSIFISPPSGPGGKDVIVQGFNFQPDREVFIEVAGVIVSTSRTQDDGRFSTRIFIPIAGRGAHTVRAIEESGNVASSSFFMDFGFDTIQEATDKLDDVLQRLDALQQKAGLPAGSVPAAAETPTSVAATGGTGGFSCNLSPQNGNSLAGADSMVLLGFLVGGLYVWGRRTRR